MAKFFLNITSLLSVVVLLSSFSGILASPVQVRDDSAAAVSDSPVCVNIVYMLMLTFSAHYDELPDHRVHVMGRPNLGVNCGVDDLACVCGKATSREHSSLHC